MNVNPAYKNFEFYLIMISIVVFPFGCSVPRLHTIPPSTEADPYIRLSNHFDYAYEGHHIDSTRLVLLPDEPPNEWKSDPLQFFRSSSYRLWGILGNAIARIGDEIERKEAEKAAKQLYENLKSVNIIKDTELENRVLGEVSERLCKSRKCLIEENADVQIVLEPILYLSGDEKNIQMVYNLWAAMKDNNKPHLYKGGMVSFYYQSEILPVERWKENDWELLSVELNKAIIETSNIFQMIVQKKSEKEIRKIISGREVDFFQRGEINCFIIKTFEAKTGKRYLYREWYFEDMRCQNARAKLEKRFEEL